MSPARPAVLGPTSKRYAPRSILIPRRTCATATDLPLWQAPGYLGMSAEMIERSYGHTTRTTSCGSCDHVKTIAGRFISRARKGLGQKAIDLSFSWWWTQSHSTGLTVPFPANREITGNSTMPDRCERVFPSVAEVAFCFPVVGPCQQRGRHRQTKRLVAVVLGTREHASSTQILQVRRAVLNPSPTTHVHEKDRLPVIWPLDSFAPVADAIGFRRPRAIDRLGRRCRGSRRGRSLLPCASLRPPARLP